MLRCIFFIIFLAAFTLKTLSVVAQSPIEILGETSNGLQPKIFVSENRYIRIEFIAQTNFSRFAWLRVTNRVGSKLQIWQTNGVQLFSKTPDVLTAIQLPHETTVSNIMHGVYPTSTRGMQWWRTGFEGSAIGESEPSTTFSLESTFDISPINDYMLQITPLLYRVETNRETAHLIEFPPIKFKLMANGNVQKR